MRFENLTTGTHYFRVIAVNAGGESRPSACLGVNVTGQPTQAMLIGAVGTSDLDDPLSQTATAYLGSARGRGGEFVRIIPRLLDRREQIPSIGDAFAANATPFDSATIESVATSAPADGKYVAVAISFGRTDPSAFANFGSELLAWSYKQSMLGAATILSGADALLGPLSVRKPAVQSGGIPEYLGKLLEIQAVAATTSTRELRGAAGTAFSTHTVSLVSGMLSRYEPREAAVFAPSNAASEFLRYAGEYDQIASVMLPRRSDRGPIIVCGFPLEEAAAIAANAPFMQTLLRHLAATPAIVAVAPASGITIKESSVPSAKAQPSKTAAPARRKAPPTPQRRTKSRR
jgi:hypothetical protein